MLPNKQGKNGFLVIGGRIIYMEPPNNLLPREENDPTR